MLELGAGELYFFTFSLTVSHPFHPSIQHSIRISQHKPKQSKQVDPSHLHLHQDISIYHHLKNKENKEAMAKGFFAKLLTSIALVSGGMVMMAQAQDEGLHPLRTHSIYMPYIGKYKPDSSLWHHCCCLLKPV